MSGGSGERWALWYLITLLSVLVALILLLAIGTAVAS